jgi:hypothetical protein
VGADQLVLGEHRVGLGRRVLDGRKLIADDRVAQPLGLAGNDHDLQVVWIEVAADRVVDLGEGQLVELGGETLEVGAIEPVEAIVDGVAEPLLSGDREVEHVLLQEFAGQLEVGGAHAVLDQQRELAVGGSQGEVGMLVGQRADPDLKQLGAAADVGRRHLPPATLREGLDVAVVAVVEAAGLTDDLKQVARRIAVLAEPRIDQP